MQAITISPVFVYSLLKGASLKGYNLESIIQAQGLSSKMLTNPRFRIPTLEFAKLSRTISLLLQDEAFGLLAKPQKLGTFELVARACLSAKTIRESLEIWRSSTNLLDYGVSISNKFNTDGGRTSIKCDMAAGIVDHYITEVQLLTTHRFHCWQANEFIPIERVDLAFSEPEFSEEYRYIFYDAKIHFEQKQNAIYFSNQTLKHKCQRNANELNTLIENTNKRLLTQPRRSKSISIKIRIWMETLFREEKGPPLLKNAANHLNMSAQTIRRHLKSEGYTFQQIKDDARRDVGIHLITRKEKSIENIAFQLGFVESSTFIRAFKKWTGLTPLEYRKL